MEATVTLTPAQLPEVLLDVAVVRPVFIWGSPGIGKSDLVTQFAASLGLPCVSLLGTQLAPEDLMGVPQIYTRADGLARSRFAPPDLIARDAPYVLFADELNAASPEVQKSFYSLVLAGRVGDYQLPAGSVVIGAGNRASDNALARTMPSALVNRFVHVHLAASAADWLVWAAGAGIHPWVTDYVRNRPDHLWSRPPKTEEAYSTPRSWHMLSDVLHSCGEDPSDERVRAFAAGTLTPQHASMFSAFVKTVRHRFGLDAILRGEARWPTAADDRDLLYFLAQSLRARLVKELPASKEHASPALRDLAHRGKGLLVELAEISLEIAQVVVAVDEGSAGSAPGRQGGPGQGVAVPGAGSSDLPAWFLAEVVRDVPRLVAAR